MIYDVLLVDDEGEETLIRVEAEESEDVEPWTSHVFLASAVTIAGYDADTIDDWWEIGSDEEQ